VRIKDLVYPAVKRGMRLVPNIWLISKIISKIGGSDWLKVGSLPVEG